MFRKLLWKTETALAPTLVRLHRRFIEPPAPNRRGERDIEYSWIAANIPEGNTEALDFASGPGWMGLLAARKGFKVTALDIQSFSWYYVHPRLSFQQGDILDCGFSPGQFDLILNISAIEHVGLVGRYGVSKERPDGDLEAMARFKTILKPGKLMLLTIPIGCDRVFSPLHRIYGPERLPRLLDGWKILSSEYWTKREMNQWVQVEASIALGKEPLAHSYGLGLFALTVSENAR